MPLVTSPAALAAALPTPLLGIPLTEHHVLLPVYGVAGLLALALFLRPARVAPRLWWPLAAAAVVVGASVGGTIIWYVGDVQNAFGVSPTWVDRIWFGAVVAGVGLVALNLVLARVWRKVVALVAVAGFGLAGGLAINLDAGEFVTSGQALGLDPTPRLVLPQPAASAPPSHDTEAAAGGFSTTWKPAADMPTHGRVGAVHIAGTASHFSARDALVYLPPAALAANAPTLPVVVLLSGQPASPTSVMQSGHVPQTMDALAGRNHGLAPIVVVPDQLGRSEANPMCVDGPLGNSATYILRDVTGWIRTHLRVESKPQDWAIGGFSQGGTCAIQFATAHPETFGAFIDVSGEKYPTLATDALAIQDGFRGDRAAFDRAKPESIMAAHGPYSNLVGFFAVGEQDAKYGRDATTMSTLARKAGITVQSYAVPGAAHDWNTATEGFSHGIASLYPRFHLAGSEAAE